MQPILEVAMRPIRPCHSSRATLYHSMTLGKAEAVLAGDMLPAGWDNVVPGLGALKGSCLSRSPHLAGGMPNRPGIVRLHFNTERLRYRNRIVPLDAEVVFHATFG